MRQLVLAGLLAAGLVVAVPAAHAEVTEQGENHFVVRLEADTPASKADAWRALIAPARWWSGEHTWSGDAANLYIDAQATGCFCEKLPRPADAPEGQRMGSVEHMHVVYADPQQGVLRMTGGLGPLQGEAIEGVWTITVKPTAEGSHITWEYVVAGHMRTRPEELAPAVDKVLGEQLGRLAALLAPPPPPSPPASEAKREDHGTL